MQHQSAENIFETNTNLGGKEHPPGLQARGPGFGGFGAELGRLGARISSLCCYAHTRGTHHFSPSAMLLLVAARTELNRRRFTGVGRAAHRRLKRHRVPPRFLILLDPRLSLLAMGRRSAGAQLTGAPPPPSVDPCSPSVATPLSLSLLLWFRGWGPESPPPLRAPLSLFFFLGM